MNADRTQDTYRGPDRRTREDRRDTSASAPPQPQSAEQRSGAERRDRVRGELWKAANAAWDAHSELAYKVVPLLAVCEFAARAQHSLNAFEFWAQRDKALMERLDGLDPEWRVAVDDALAPLHIAQCIGMARNLCASLADTMQAASDAAYSVQQEGGRHG